MHPAPDLRMQIPTAGTRPGRDGGGRLSPWLPGGGDLPPAAPPRPDSAQPRAPDLLLPRLLLPLSAAALIALQVLDPAARLDAVTLALFAIGAVPWLMPFVRAVSLPFVAEIAFRDLEALAQAARGAGLIAVTPLGAAPSARALPIEFDPNVALVRLGLALERLLGDLADRARLPDAATTPLLVGALTVRGTLRPEQGAVLLRLDALARQAAHGARVDPGAVLWTLTSGQDLLAAVGGLDASPR